MRYTVLWRDEVHNDLARLWVDSIIRQQLTSAADQIDVELADDAHLKGLDIGDDHKVIRIPPLVIHFRIDIEDRKVFVETIDLMRG